MNQLYNEIGTYSGVAKEMGISAGTVSRYIRQDKEELNKKEKINKILDLEDNICLKEVPNVTLGPSDLISSDGATLTYEQLKEIFQ